MAKYHARHVAGEVELPTEGVAGDNPPDDGESHVKELQLDGELAKMIQAIKTLNPTTAAEIERLVDNERERRMAFDKTTSLVGSNGTVKIGGMEVPIILTGPSEPDPVNDFVCPDHPDTKVVRTESDKAECVLCGYEFNAPPEPENRPGWAFVPTTDPDYRFDIWRAERLCGAVKFVQKVSDLITLLLCGQRVLLVGPPAVGKSSIFEQFAARCGYPVTRFNGNRDITVQDFVGNYEARDGCTVWCDGPLPRAMKEGHILLLDEVDHMPAECSSVLHSVLEPNGRLVMTAKGGEVIHPHENFRIVATSNTAGYGDESGLHPNAQVQDAAFLSRFDAVFRVTWMGFAHERNLIMKISGIDRSLADKIVSVARDTRKAVENSDMLYPVTLRQTIGWARMSKLLDDHTGFALAVLNKVPQQDVAAVAEIAQRHFGEKFGGKLATGK
jgi:cobaltochelatase CobS